MSPEKLVEPLVSAGLEEEHAAVFQSVWAQCGKDYVAKMRERTLGGPTLLKQSTWRLQVKVGQETSQKEKVPTAIFDFHLGSDHCPTNGGGIGSIGGNNGGNGNGDETVSLEFTKADLYKFFDNLEEIQSQLDTLM